jgi:hypothetical protein
LPYRLDCINAWFIEQHTSTTIEHAIEETSEKSGETSFPLETSEKTSIDMTLV